jgi:ABC-type transport system involved in cytochrome c biogenesis permease subunit
MTRHDLLSPAFGIPVALVTMLLLFSSEWIRSIRGWAPRWLNVAAALATCLLVVLVIGRFAEYS